MSRIELVRKMSPVGRFHYWIEEREAIRLARANNLPKPWTEDEILQDYRFCNVRRMDDKVSKWLDQNWYTPHINHSNMLVACALARFINLPESLAAIAPFIFVDGSLKWGKIRDSLRKRREDGHTLFNGAYMVRGNDGQDKIESVVDYYVKPLSGATQLDYLIDRSSMRVSVENLCGEYGFGTFMAGQVVADLRWALEGSWSDKDDWAAKGPGSTRGMNRYFDKPVKQGIKLAYFQEGLGVIISRAKRSLPEGITGRLEAHDYQNCLCEYDKYCRALLGEGKPKQKYSGTD